MKLFLKVGALLGVFLLLVVSLGRIHFLSTERAQRRDAVVRDIARSTGYAQTLSGPVLVVPYTRTIREWETDNGARREVTREISGRLHLLPETFALDGRLSTEERQRGIYRARVYTAATRLQAKFQVPAFYGITEDRESWRFSAPVLALGVSDIRGIGNGLTLESGGERINFEPGSSTPVLPTGVHAPLGARDASQPLALDVDIRLDMLGTGSFSVLPVGRSSVVKLASDWPHPSFTGEFLPRERLVDNKGFTASWQTSFFATNLQEGFIQCGEAGDSKSPACAGLMGRAFGVSFIDPVDQYLKTERAIKYGFLFIGLTFAAFFLFEVLRRFSVHPVQYGLVGLSLALFFLLLLALAEHIGFNSAYLVAALACVLLNGYYVTHVLGSRANGLAFSGALAGLYGLLFGILQSEDYALLMGALLLFALLAVVMVLTRRVRWNSWEALK